MAMAMILTGVTSGCVNIHSSSIRGVGYVRLEDVVKHHPLYPQLSQLDDAIAAINLQAAAPHVPLSAAQITQQTQELNKELQAAQIRTNKILVQKQQDYVKREQQAISAALAAAGVKGAGSYAAQALSATSAQQVQQAAAAANADLAAYQQSVVSQNSATASAIVRQLQAQAAQAYRARAEQLEQNETNLSLRLTQEDAPQRLAIKTRLSNLALDETTRKQLMSQLAALDTKEASAVAAARRADGAQLVQYRAQLNSQTRAAIAQQVGRIQAQTNAKIATRRNEVGAQLRGLGPPPLPAKLPAGVQAKIAQINRQFTASFQADAQQTINDYASTKADLDRQFAALHGADVGATGAAAKELTALQKRRDDLYGEIVDQVQREAARIAKDRGFSVVFGGVEAAPGGYDLTNEVTKDVESLHE
jgi:Outer membrane protein (OmpH-like)